MGNGFGSILRIFLSTTVYFSILFAQHEYSLFAATESPLADQRLVNLISLNSVLTAICLLFIAFILYFQLREFRLLRKQSDILSVKKEDEPLPILNFYNGRVHSNGMVSVKLKNTGETIKDIKFISENSNVDLRSGNKTLNKHEDITISFVPDGFNFTESYFEKKDLVFSINYKSILNDTKKERFIMQNPQTVFKL